MTRNKYGNEPTDGCRYGFSHRSKLEAAVCRLIYFREKAGELKHLAHEVHVDVCGPPGHECAHKQRIQYVADFQCEDASGRELLIEAKGFSSDAWRIKRRLLMHYSAAMLEIWGGSWQRPSLIETIVPKGAA